MKKSLIALAFGTLAMGIAEFVMMGILPEVAKALGLPIATAGHFISAYAIGVCVGAPVLTLARKLPLKHILLALVAVMMIGNLFAAQGNGGVFCWYSYISPLLTHVSGFSSSAITPLMMLAGFGMVAGNLISGRLSDKYSPAPVAAFVQACLFVFLLLIFFLASNPWISATLMTLCTAGLFALSSPQQVLIIRHSPGGEMLGAASVQMAFNLGNALGAYCGGLPLQAGSSYRYPALVGAPFALIGFILLTVFYKKFEKRKQPA